MPNLIAADEAIVDAAELEEKAGHADAAKKLAGDLDAAWSNADRDAPLTRRLRAIVDSGAEQKKR